MTTSRMDLGYLCNCAMFFGVLQQGRGPGLAKLSIPGIHTETPQPPRSRPPSGVMLGRCHDMPWLWCRIPQESGHWFNFQTVSDRLGLTSFTIFRVYHELLAGS